MRTPGLTLFAIVLPLRLHLGKASLNERNELLVAMPEVADGSVSFEGLTHR